MGDHKRPMFTDWNMISTNGNLITSVYMPELGEIVQAWDGDEFVDAEVIDIRESVADPKTTMIKLKPDWSTQRDLSTGFGRGSK